MTEVFISTTALWGKDRAIVFNPDDSGEFVTIYFDKPKSSWISLTNDDLLELITPQHAGCIAYGRNVEAKLMEKNT